MGAFFTNVQVRVPTGRDAKEVAQLVLDHVGEHLIGEGFRLAKEGEASDREFVIIWGPAWVSFYDQYAEDQSGVGAEWARWLSETLALDTVSVLVHDSDVLDLGLYVDGKQRDRYDSNPAFSGKKPSTMKPAARAERWARVLAPGRTPADLETVFESRDMFAESALQHFAPALGIELQRVATGFNYLTRDPHPLPASHIRVRCRRTKRPAWEKRLTGKPKLGSQWDGYDASDLPVQPPQRFLEGNPAQLMSETINRGGPGTGLRIELAVESAGECLALERVEVVRSLPGRLHMSRHDAALARGAGGLLFAELPDLELLPGAPTDLDLEGAPLDEMMNVSHAGKIHLNVYGKAVRAGKVRVAITYVPLSNPRGQYTTHVDVEVQAVRGAPLRATGELHPHMLDGLTTESSSYVLVLLDESVDASKQHAIELLEALRPVWPKGRWTAFASDSVFELGPQIDIKGALSDKKVWSTLTKPLLAMTSKITATCETKARGGDDSSGFELDVGQELRALVVVLPVRAVAADEVAAIVTPIVDAWALAGLVTQAVLARWEIGYPGTITPYETVVGIHGDEAAHRAWAERWIRAVGPGQLWLGRALTQRAGDLDLADRVPLDGSVRIAVHEVAPAEQALAALLPTAQQFEDYMRTVLPDEVEDE